MKLIHIWWHRYSDSDDARDRRHALARYSWEMEAKHSPFPWDSAQPPETLPNSSALGDPQPMPFVPDMIDSRTDGADADDVVLLTNGDIIIAGGVSDRIVAAVREYGSAHMKRKEIGPNATRIPSAQEIIDAPEYCGMDGAAFTVKWWRDNRFMMPMAVFGRYGWDSICRNLIRLTGGVEIKNALAHIEHVAQWNSSLETIYKNPSNYHNRLLLWEWILAHGGSDADHLFADGELKYRK